jgi:hypothetical protein
MNVDVEPKSKGRVVSCQHDGWSNTAIDHFKGSTLSWMHRPQKVAGKCQAWELKKLSSGAHPFIGDHSALSALNLMWYDTRYLGGLYQYL